MNRADGQLGLIELIAIGVGGMIGGGIFSVLGIAVGISEANVPWVAVVVLTGLGITFSIVSTLEDRGFFEPHLLARLARCGHRKPELYRQTGARRFIVVFGIAVVLLTMTLLIIYMWTEARHTLASVGVLYGVVLIVELAFSQRRLIRRKLKGGHMRC